MSKDRPQGDEQTRVTAHWVGLLSRNPAEAARFIAVNPRYKAMLAAFAQQTFSQEIQVAENDRQWLPRLFGRYLPPEEPGVIVSLFSGEADELLHLRSLYPNARMVAIDNSKDPTTIQATLIHSLVTNAEFIHRDVEQIRSNTVFQKQKPYLVMRHPGPLVGGAAQQLPRVIASWSRDAITRGGHVLVTSYTQREHATIAKALEQQRLQPQLHTFEGGEDIYARARTGDNPANAALSQFFGELASRSLGETPISDSHIITISAQQ